VRPTNDPARLYTERADAYVRFVRLVGYPAGLRAYFRASPLLHSGLRVFDAGCGTGILTLALRDALVGRGLQPWTLHGCDLTPAMLERFRATLQRRDIQDVELWQADVLRLAALPPAWRDYDLVVSASMMEYLPRDRLVDALAGLRGLLAPDGRLVLFITRRNALMRPLIGRWWEANLYDARELAHAFDRAGFPRVAFGKFPLAFRHLALWGHIVVAQR
jgi:SAM-dependent methyltransferase